MVLVTDKITLPVGFAFYEPDQGIEAWKKENAQQIKAGIAKKDRVKRPKPSADYRSKTQLFMLVQNYNLLHISYIYLLHILNAQFFFNRMFNFFLYI